jgi:hypothetical protein
VKLKRFFIKGNRGMFPAVLVLAMATECPRVGAADALTNLGNALNQAGDTAISLMDKFFAAQHKADQHRIQQTQDDQARQQVNGAVPSVFGQLGPSPLPQAMNPQNPTATSPGYPNNQQQQQQLGKFQWNPKSQSNLHANIGAVPMPGNPGWSQGSVPSSPQGTGQNGSTYGSQYSLGANAGQTKYGSSHSQQGYSPRGNGQVPQYGNSSSRMRPRGNTTGNNSGWGVGNLRY